MTARYSFFLLFTCLVFIFCNQQEEKKITASPADVALLAKAYQHCLLITKMADEAITRSTYNGTKELAMSLSAESEKIRSALDVISGKKEIELPLDISQQQLDKWQSLVKIKGGWSFDQEFLNTAILLKTEQQQKLGQIESSAVDKDLKAVAAELKKAVSDNTEVAKKVKEIKEARIRKDSLTTEVAIEE
jgi:predicted outer membrane protein